MNLLFDTHAHLPEPDTDFAEFYTRAAAAGVPAMLLCGTGMASSEQSARAAASQKSVFFAAGVHPLDIADNPMPADEFRKFALMPDFAAIGELGLDYYYDGASPERQMEVLQSFLDLALELKRPAVIHCRDKNGSELAYEHAYQLLKPFSERGGTFVLHAFAGTPDWAQKFLLPGVFFGIGGMVTFKKADNIRESASVIPLDRILLETDTPYLAPVPFRGKPNHPALLPYTAQYLAEFKQISVEELARITTANALRFLQLPEDVLV